MTTFEPVDVLAPHSEITYYHVHSCKGGAECEKTAIILPGVSRPLVARREPLNSDSTLHSAYTGAIRGDALQYLWSAERGSIDAKKTSERRDTIPQVCMVPMSFFSSLLRERIQL